MPTLVSGGAIERYVKANSLTALTDEESAYAGQAARCLTDKGEVVWANGEADARLLPFGEPA